MLGTASEYGSLNRSVGEKENRTENKTKGKRDKTSEKTVDKRIQIRTRKAQNERGRKERTMERKNKLGEKGGNEGGIRGTTESEEWRWARLKEGGDETGGITLPACPAQRPRPQLAEPLPAKDVIGQHGCGTAPTALETAARSSGPPLAATPPLKPPPCRRMPVNFRAVAHLFKRETNYSKCLPESGEDDGSDGEGGPPQGVQHGRIGGGRPALEAAPETSSSCPGPSTLLPSSRMRACPPSPIR